MSTATTEQLTQLNDKLWRGDIITRAAAAEKLADFIPAGEPSWTFTVYDYLWRPFATIGDDMMEASGTDPRNDLPSATIKLKGKSDTPGYNDLIELFRNCRTTMVGVTVETQGMRFAYYVDTFDEDYTETGERTFTANLLGVWDILNFMVVWPNFLLPIQAQVPSHAVFFWGLCTVIESMVAECSLRLQSGLWEFVNNALSLNPDIRSWFGTLLESNGNIFKMLKTPLYVVRTNPFLDTSPLVARTVRMETCGTVIKDITRAYGVDVRLDLWLPGDEQPDQWANLDQPTYVFTAKDRSQITGPTQTVLDSALRTVVDLEGSLLGNTLNPLLNPQGEYSPENVFIAPVLGLNFVKPHAILIAPEPGQHGSVTTCKISHHTPKGWQHIVGGRSPKWLNDMMNATFAWIIDSISILVGFSGIPSDLLSGFLNDAFLAFQLIEHFGRRNSVGPYHPGVEVMHATASAPYNVETLFAFINALWDSRGYTSALATFRNGDVLTYGKDLVRGGLASVLFDNRTKLFTDYVENVMFRITPQDRDLMVQIGDGKAKEAPLAKDQRLISGIFEIVNVLTLAPQS